MTTHSFNIKRTLLVIVAISIAGLSIVYFWPEQPLSRGHTITRLVVLKSKHRLIAYAGDTVVKTYKISLGKNPIGQKMVEGDNKTPEGVYIIFAKNPRSTCYKNLGISYPNAKDIAKARSLRKSAGGDIKIHGLPNHQGFWGKLHRMRDWTNGCIAVTNAEMDELYTAVKIGTTIDIRP